MIDDANLRHSFLDLMWRNQAYSVDQAAAFNQTRIAKRGYPESWFGMTYLSEIASGSCSFPLEEIGKEDRLLWVGFKPLDQLSSAKAYNSLLNS